MLTGLSLKRHYCGPKRDKDAEVQYCFRKALSAVDQISPRTPFFRFHIGNLNIPVPRKSSSDENDRTPCANSTPFNPCSTAVPFRGQTIQIISSLCPKRECGAKKGYVSLLALQSRFGDNWVQITWNLSGLSPKRE